MPDSGRDGAENVREAVQSAVAAKPERRRRARAYQITLLAIAAAFLALAIAARSVPYFSLDLAITHAFQSHQGVFLARLMEMVSWPGYWPQAFFIGAGVAAALFAVGLRWEAVATTLSIGGLLIGSIVKVLVYRPRPSADLVHVVRELSSWSFPSGHVIAATTFCGFLAFLAFTLLRRSWIRTGLVAGLWVTVLLMGPSRIYQGEHWFSDVVGGYALGALWLAVTIEIYRRGKPRFFARQPVAPEAQR